MTPRKTVRRPQLASKQNSPRLDVASPWSLSNSKKLQILQLEPFSKLPWLVHGFSTITGGVSPLDGRTILNLGFTRWDKRENVLKNRSFFSAAVDGRGMELLALNQIHSDIPRVFSEAPGQPCSGDALLTDRPGLLLAVQTADCVPVLLVDVKRRNVAAVHAGWRGTLARISQKAVGRMRLEYGSRPSDLLAAIGPSIGLCCYEVGVELVTQFQSQFADADSYFDEARTGDEPNPIQWLNMKPPGHQPPPKNVHLDLRAANRSQLLAAGVHPSRIFVSGLCTACHPDFFFSFRKQGEPSGRLLSVIGIRP